MRYSPFAPGQCPRRPDPRDVSAVAVWVGLRLGLSLPVAQCLTPMDARELVDAWNVVRRHSQTALDLLAEVEAPWALAEEARQDTERLRSLTDEGIFP